MDEASKYQTIPHHLPQGSLLNGKYTIEGVLGEGGFGITYVGHDKYLDMKVAIKEYYPTGIVNRNHTYSKEITAHLGDSLTLFEKGKKSFLEEARMLAMFCNEASIVSVRDFFEENNTAYIVMEYLDGMDLKEYMLQVGKMTFVQTMEIISPIMNALSKVHAKGLIHRDISPSNIKILEEGRAVLLDFGAARNVSGMDEKSLSVMLKPGYAPEEQYRTKGKQGPWTDVYALSATMYKMMTGVTPDDAMNRIFADETKSVFELNPSVTVEQNAVILKGLAVHQTNRYQTIEELHNACEASLGKGTHVEETVIGRGINFCEKCGSKVEPGAKFCTDCGAKLEVYVGIDGDEPTVCMQDINMDMQNGNGLQNTYTQQPVYTEQSKLHNGKVSFIKAVKLFFVNYANFTGRASRSEFWWGFLLNFLVSLICSFMSSFGMVISLAFIIPWLSLCIRRLHDIGKSWVWYLMGFIPLAGLIIMIVFYCQDSERSNQWGYGPEYRVGDE